jgi:hypothetical protein
LRDLQRDGQVGGAGAEEASSLRDADRRENYIHAVWDAELPQMVKVLLYELASRLDLTLSDWSEGKQRVHYEGAELARCIGLDREAVDLCRYLAIEANWLVEVGDGVLELREPHEDWDLYLGFLKDEKKPVADRGVYRSRLAAFQTDVERLRAAPLMSVRGIREAMLAVVGHTYVPKCVGGEFARSTHGLGSGRKFSNP